MAKRKEIKFKQTAASGTTLEGRQNGVIYRIYRDRTLAGTGTPDHTVTAYDTEEPGKAINTAGHMSFNLEDAVEFCQQIAAGEITLEDLQAKFEAEDTAAEQAAMREITEKAKKFHARLDAMGLSYRDLLELEVMAHALGDMGHNILLGYERGEGWPAEADTAPAEQEPETVENPYWAIYPLPEDCRSLFVFAGAGQFDRCVKNGVIPLHDGRESYGGVRIPCFIGYAATQNLKCLDKLAGLSETGGKESAVHVVEVHGRQASETSQDFVKTVKQIIRDRTGLHRTFQ